MRKRILCVLTLSMLLILMPVFAACGTHEHTYKMDHDDTQHWKSCTGCSYRSDPEPHNYNDDNICEDCEYEFVPPNVDHDHDWDITVTREATCILNGSQTKICKICRTKEFETIVATGHDWKITAIFKEATCSANGEGSVVCTVCQTTETNHIFDPTGHQFGDEVILDKEPTEFEYGYKSRHCAMCSERTDVEALEPTGSLKTATYRIYVSRADERRMVVPLPISIKFPKGNVENPLGGEQTFSNPKRDADGLYYYDVTLPLDTYEVSLANSVAASYDITTYTVSPSKGEYPFDIETKYPTLDMKIKSHPMTNPSMKLSGNIQAGDIISDFKFTDVNGKERTLSQVLKTCKLVWFYFYKNDCPPCQDWVNVVKAAYNEYKNDVTVICFNGNDDDDAIKTGAKSIYDFPAEYILVNDTDRSVMKRFTASMPFPFHAFIDNSGYVCETFQANRYLEQFEAILSDNIALVDKGEANLAAATAQLAPSTLSEKLNFPTAA